jgi:hypothetical protein
MADFAGLLRKLDTCDDKYRYSTVSHNRAIIDKPYLALLASTAPSNLYKYASKGNDFWTDGFWARFAFCCPPSDEWTTHTMDQLYGQMDNPDEDNPLEDLLIDYLKSLQGGATTVREIVQHGLIELRKLKADGIRDLLLSLERSGIVECVREGRKECYKLSS